MIKIKTSLQMAWAIQGSMMRYVPQQVLIALGLSEIIGIKFL